MANAMDVAQYFLAVAPGEEGITHLKLEKLIAYAQAVSLALLGEPLFSEELEAWAHGPVAPTVYHALKSNGSAPIFAKYSEQRAREPFTDEQKFILEIVNGYYGEYETWALRQRSHVDFPGQFGRGLPIPKDIIKQRFQENELVKRLKAAYSDLSKEKPLAPESRHLTIGEFSDALGL